MKTVGGILAFVCVVVGLHFMYTRSGVDTRPSATDQVIQLFRTNVDSFTHLEHRPPVSFDEACRRLLPQEYLYVKDCSYWLDDKTSIPTDGWRHPLRYSVSGATVEIRSAGADGIFNTPDDMFYNSADEARRVGAMAGCYQIHLGWPQFPGTMLQLDSGLMFWRGEYRGSPSVYGHFGPQWRPNPYPGGRDSLTVIWRTTEDQVLLRFRSFGDSLVGNAEGQFIQARVVAHRTSCPSSP